jgi:hypothetical protein
MSPKSSSIEVLKYESVIKYIKNDYNVKEIIPFDEINGSEGLFLLESNNIFKGNITNVAIASAITAYARIHIDNFKRIPGNECFYSDTDSVF